MYAATRVPNVKWGAHLKWEARHHCPPTGYGPEIERPGC